MVILTNKKDEESVLKTLKIMSMASGEGVLILKRIGEFRASGDTILLYDNGDYHIIVEKDSEWKGTACAFITFDFANVDMLNSVPEKKGKRCGCIVKSNHKDPDQDLIMYLLAQDDIFFEYREKLFGLLEEYDNNRHDSLYAEESRLNMHCWVYDRYVFVKSSDGGSWLVYEYSRRGC